MYICLCKGITEKQLDEIIDQHQGCRRRVARTMGLDKRCCGRCTAQLPDLISSRMAKGSFLPAS